MEGGKRLLYEGQMPGVSKTMDTKEFITMCRAAIIISIATIYNWQIEMILTIFI